MSNHISSEVCKRLLGSATRKAVLALMADKASDYGTGIWASKQTMADELEVSKQTVITTIKGLLADGILIEAGHRRCANGYLVEYAINLQALRLLPLVKAHAKDRSSSLTGQAALPVKEIDPTGQAALPHQSNCLTQTIQEPSKNLTPPTPRRGEERVRPAEIPIDWQAPAIDDLPPEIAGLGRQWPAGAYAAECAAFHQHWRGRGTRRADWAALWAARVQGRHVEVMRAAKAGVVFDGGGAAGNATAAMAERAPVAAKSREGSRAAEVHAALGERLGQRIWQQWFDPVALVFDADGLVVIAPSAFHAAQLEAQYGPALAEVLDCLNIGIDWTRFSAERGAGAGADKRAATRKTGGAKRG